jgi:hypothetical protein
VAREAGKAYAASVDAEIQGDLENEEKAMTIEEARNLIAESEDEISKILTRLYDEVGIAPQSISVGLDVELDADYHYTGKLSARIEGMTL